MRSLIRIWDLARKEVLESASTPFLFLVTAVFLFLSGNFFYSGALYYSQLSAEWLANPSLQKTALNASNLLLPPLFSNYSLLLLFLYPCSRWQASRAKSGMGPWNCFLRFRSVTRRSCWGSGSGRS